MMEIDDINLRRYVREMNPNIKTKHTCLVCGDRFKQLGNHWQWNPSHAPDINDHQHQVIRACMMGDGSLDRHNKRPRLTVCMKNKWYISELVNELCGLVSSVNKQKSGQYKLSTYALENLKIYDWYNGGDKTYPPDIELTDTVLRHWYIQDGSLDWRSNSKRARACISCTNEKHDMDKIQNMFSNTGLSPSCSPGSGVVFTVGDTESMLMRIGDPPRSYEYKWCNKDRGNYTFYK